MKVKHKTCGTFTNLVESQISVLTSGKLGYVVRCNSCNKWTEIELDIVERVKKKNDKKEWSVN